jgi:hypothetical protein
MVQTALNATTVLSLPDGGIPKLVVYETERENATESLVQYKMSLKGRAIPTQDEPEG